MRYLFPTLFLCGIFGTALRAEEAERPLAAARQHLQKGRYAEALEAYGEIDKTGVAPAQVAIGRSRCFQAEGKWKEATAALKDAVKKNPRHAKLWARLAEVQFLQGRFEETNRAITQALEIDKDSPLAHLVQADLLAATGKLIEADAGYLWFVRYYNRAQPTDAETLLLVARGTNQYARWNSASQNFNFVINTLCPDALADDPEHWQALALSGGLLIEKYNRAQAKPELRKALAVNPRAADVHARLAQAAFADYEIEYARQFVQRTLEIDPHHIVALQVRADLELSEGKLAEALATLKQALAVNPHDENTLGRVAACYLIQDGPPTEEKLRELLKQFSNDKNTNIATDSRFSRLVTELAERNPNPGRFLTVLGSQLESRRKFQLAERFYKLAMDRMPMLSQPQTALGMLYMRIGKVADAKKILDRAFDLDPFHVRVSNMRKVIGVLSGYEIISTDHFVIRVDSKLDKVLGHYMAEYLEEEYDKLTKQFGYEPPARTQFEIYNKAKGLSAHAWFSARMVGLPWIQTIGASTGVIVALASPTAVEKQFNWARVLRHEFVHVITLQQTEFNIPHWFTEALAVRNEGYPRPQSWNEMLAKRVPLGEMMNLDNINQSFIRPEKPEDWQMAYCQSELYAEFMVKEFGPETLAKMLDAYRDNLSTAGAIQKVCGVDQPTFERGYLKYVKGIVAKLPETAAAEQLSLADLEKAYEADPENSQMAARFALGLMQAQQTEKARELAEAALEQNPKEPLAAAVMAMLAVRAEDEGEAALFLEEALDRDNPHPQIVEMLAPLWLKAGEFDKAVALYESALKSDPQNTTWIKGLAAVYLKQENTAKLKPLLLTLVTLESDQTAPQKKLAEIFLAEKNFSQALKHAKGALYIDVLDADVHRLLGESQAGLKQFQRAVAEYAVAIELKPGDAVLLFGLAKSHFHAGDKEAARKTLERLLKKHPDHAAGQELQGRL